MKTSITNRITTLFQEKNNHLLSVYFTAGFPHLEDTVSIMEHLQEGGADLIEIGIPFSDPMADGPTIQESNQAALHNGMTLKQLFQQLENIRGKIHIPIILMGYFNPIMQYGLEKFCETCERLEIDGLIVPDLPMQDYLNLYKQQFDQYGIFNIFLITPQTSEDRIREIDKNSNGFIYMVSSASITGAKSSISEEQINYFQRVQQMKLKNPRLIGFGISNRETFDMACNYASGAIIGSAFIKVLQQSKNLREDIINYIKSVKGL
jgi:tryptophan synthase alpha chain